jgi:hypothetical protein
MLGISVVGGVVASSMAVYWYFIWRTGQRWNMLLRRAGKAPDDDVMKNTSKIVGFMLSEQHKAFDDAKLSQLVTRARLSFAMVLGGLVLWVVSASLVG